MDFLRINGAYGEGGGQIVRTCIALSCITKRPVIIENIRKGRRSPGLKAQHITAIKILQSICNAKVKGASNNSTTLHFIPGDIQGCKLKANVGTAGSISLILQSVIPAMVFSKEKSEVEITGGTDVLWSPTFDYMVNVVKETFGRMGLEFSLNLKKRGYYPKGGGKAILSARSQEIKPIKLVEKRTNVIKIKCSYSKISSEIIKREVKKIEDKLIEKYDTKSEIKDEAAFDFGASILVHTNDDYAIQGSDGLFDKKTASFNMNLDKLTRNYLGVDENLADMIVLPASIANGLSIFRVPKLTKHLETNLFVASKISGCKYGIGKVDGGFEVRIEGTSHPCIHQ